MSVLFGLCQSFFKARVKLPFRRVSAVLPVPGLCVGCDGALSIAAVDASHHIILYHMYYITSYRIVPQRQRRNSSPATEPTETSTAVAVLLAHSSSPYSLYVCHTRKVSLAYKAARSMNTYIHIIDYVKPRSVRYTPSASQPLLLLYAYNTIHPSRKVAWSTKTRHASHPIAVQQTAVLAYTKQRCTYSSTLL